MRLTKAQRDELKAKFGGLCAYCGAPLGDRWHADHFKAVSRELTWESGKGFRSGAPTRPQHDTIENMMPSCAPCNIDKHSLPLEAWRAKLHSALDVLARNNPTYRHAVRFGLIAATGKNVAFHFESVPHQEGE